jgi:N-carbamoyl-L-amino-acid hydrolase
MGEANHAGTTIMPERRDALMAAAEFCLAFERAVQNIHCNECVGTIGCFEITPNAVNIIPGESRLLLEIRSFTKEKMAAILGSLAQDAALIEERRGVRIKRKTILEQDGILMDTQLAEALCAASEQAGVKPVRLLSMAGHDAAHMASIGRAAMLFVRSAAGKSHCPEEYSSLSDIAKAGDVLLNCIIALDRELDSPMQQL